MSVLGEVYFVMVLATKLVDYGNLNSEILSNVHGYPIKLEVACAKPKSTQLIHATNERLLVGLHSCGSLCCSHARIVACVAEIGC